jgi:PEGA domain-containing protein
MKHGFRWAWSSLCTLSLLAGGSADVRAATPEADNPELKEDAKVRIRELITKADKAFGAARYEDSARAYLEAHDLIEHYKLGKSPELLFNAGLSFERIEACDRVAELFARYLAEKPEAATADLRYRLKRARDCAPEVDVKSNPPKAIVEIDGDPRGITPAKLHLRSGAHTLRLTLDGHEPLEASFNVRLHRPMALSYKLKTSARGGRIALDLGPGVSLSIDGARASEGPFHGYKELALGSHQVLIEKEGCRPKNLQIKVPGDAEPITVDANLECKTVSAAADTGAIAPHSESAGGGEVAAKEPTPPAPSLAETSPAPAPGVDTSQQAVAPIERSGGPPALAWVFGGVGVASLAAGIILAVISHDHVTKRDHELMVAESTRMDSVVRSEQDAAFTTAVGAHVGFGVAAVAFIGAGIVWALDGGDGSTEVSIAPSGASVRVQW